MAMALTASLDETVRLWDLNSGLPFFTMTPHKTGVTRAKFHPNGLHFLTCGKDNTVQILDIRKRGVVQTASTKGEPKCIEIG
jgi:WD40 repeat protein